MTFFEASSLIVFFASIGFGLLIYSHDRVSSLSKIWLFFSSIIATWSFSLYKVVSSESAEGAFIWQSILDVTGIFIPLFYFIFISTFLKLKNRYVRTFFFIFAISFAAFSTSTFFKKGVTDELGFYWIDPGAFYFLFPVFFITLVGYSIWVLMSVYKKTDDLLLKNQIRYHIFAAIVGFGGGATNFSPQLFGAFYPFGNYFLLLYLFFLSYSILRHQLFSAKVIAAELLVSAITLFLLFNFLIYSSTFFDGIVNFLLFTIVSVVGFLVVLGVAREVRTRERIEGLVKDLAKANEHLRRVEQQKSEFVSIASHQLRTPLTAIKGYASMILEGSFGALSSEARSAVEKLFKSSQRLVGLVEDFLTVSRIERGKMEFNFAVVDIQKIVTDTAENINLEARDKGIALTVQVEQNGAFNVRGDGPKLVQVLNNIIDNAIKFTTKGFVRILLTRDNDARKIRIAVSDTGAGMEFNTIIRLFKRYDEELSSDKSRSIGMSPGGLGLYVSHQIIKAHGGTIWAQSEGVGKGSTFFVELPESGSGER